MNDFKDIYKLFGQPAPSPQQQHQRPSIPIPPKPPLDHQSSFTGALTSFYSDPFPENENRPFSELLAGALAIQLPASGELNWGNDSKQGEDNANGGFGGSSRFKDNRPGSLVLPPVAPMFTVSPGFSPSAFLNSPTFPSPVGISPQQNMAHVTAQAALSQAHLTIQHDTNQHSSIPSSMSYQPSFFNAGIASRHPVVSEHPTLERRRITTSIPAAVDKPADDGFNWRKYGQKQVKGSEYPRSYYRCTTPNCPVKKKVERSFDGHITEIIYKGQHNHERPQAGRRGKDNNSLMAGDGAEGQFGNTMWLGRPYDSAPATSMQLPGPSDSEDSGENSELVEDDDDYNDEPKAKRRNGGAGQSDGSFTRTTMTEPKIVVQTRSDVDLLDDGYRWRKYGQKVVKGNPNPRSYYKCTTVGCKVRKHVERASTDKSAVITTYEGKHNHDVPAARGGGGSSSSNTANMEASQTRMHNSVGQVNFGSNNDQRPITLRLKEEQLVVA